MMVGTCESSPAPTTSPMASTSGRRVHGVLDVAVEGETPAGGPGPPDETVDAGQVVGVDQRADVGGLVAGIALAEVTGPVQEPLGELGRDRGVDEQPGTGQADLPGVVELLDGERDGQVQVGV